MDCVVHILSEFRTFARNLPGEMYTRPLFGSFLIEPPLIQRTTINLINAKLYCHANPYLIACCNLEGNVNLCNSFDFFFWRDSFISRSIHSCFYIFIVLSWYLYLWYRMFCTLHVQYWKLMTIIFINGNFIFCCYSNNISLHHIVFLKLSRGIKKL